MKLTYLIIILAFITCVIVSGCGGGENTAVPSVNGSVTPSSGSGGTFSITVHIPGPENMEVKVIPWQRKTLRVTVKPETGLTAITPVTVDISGPGYYTATVPKVPVGLNEATIEVLDANDRLLAMRKQGFQMDHGGDVKPADPVIMGVSLDPSGGLHCDPNYIEIKKGESLYVENQDTGAGYTVTIGSENHSVSAATASASPVTAATFPAQAFGTFSANAGVYDISAGGPVLGRVKVYDYNASFVPEMVLITAGTFQMGDPDGGVGDSGERPRHEVTLTRNFYMSKYEIRNKEYICYDPAHTGIWSDPNYPVENVSWYNAVTYCNWLSAQKSLPLCYTDSDNDGNLDTVDITKDGYRMPTEAEWEYACRAGETTFHDYYWGDDGTSPPNIGTYCWYGSNSGSHPNVVGTKLANNFGLFDMNGNLWEWVNDWYGSYNITAQTDPNGPGSGSIRVIRGGGWFNIPVGCRSAGRGSTNIPSSCGSGIGFRPVRTDLTDYSVYGYNISSFSPGSGDEGDTVTIYGTFHSNPSNNIVTFNGVYTPTLPGSNDNQLQVTVPAGVTTGKISVRTPGGTATSTVDFVVTDSLDGFVPLAGGTFTMGTYDATPTHSVTLNPFYIKQHEITYNDYCAFLNEQTSIGYGWISVDGGDAYIGLSGDISNPSGITVKSGYETCPVVYVSWYGAVAYCNWLSGKNGLTPCYDPNMTYDSGYNEDPNIWRQKNGYRLPTEAEWEYACRGGVGAEYYWGATYPPAPPLSSIGPYAWFWENSSEGIGMHLYHPVGQKTANNYGLYDMSGNVSEWCSDWYEAYSGTAQTNPVGPGTGEFRVFRGGGWSNAAGFCRSAYRNGTGPSSTTPTLGFRPVRSKI